MNNIKNTFKIHQEFTWTILRIDQNYMYKSKIYRNIAELHQKYLREMNGETGIGRIIIKRKKGYEMGK